MDKKQILLDHLAIAKTTVALDPTVEGVLLPKNVKEKDTVIRLNLSNNYPIEFRQDKVITTLKFGGVPFECHIPYKAIFVIMIAGNLEDAVLFEESLPEATKRILPLIQSGNYEALRFMADFEKQLSREDITIGSLEGTDKPQ
jgi:stringent starvation protein B